jgi:hypothetical protein
MEYETARIKYFNDPIFHRLVDIIEHAISDLSLAPFELTEATNFAITRAEIKSLEKEKELWIN